jgi:predicted nucleotidyltransferase
MKNARFADTLRVLVRHEVEFIVVGMAAGILQGVPLTTLDVDIVHQRTPDNVARLTAALAELRAIYRGDPRQLSPGALHLTGPGHQLLTTDHGDLDCLGTVDDGKSYEDLLPHTNELEIGGGATIKVLELSQLIEVKRRAGRPKDLAAIPFLEATLDEIRRAR